MIHKATDMLKMYPAIKLYLDNDRTGDEATQILNRKFAEVEDCRILYRNYKDLNEFLMSVDLRKRDERRTNEDLRKMNTR